MLGITNKLVIGIINRIVDIIYKNSDKILCSSQGFVQNIADRGVPREKLIYWPQFCEEPEYENITKPTCYDKDYFNIVFAGNIGYAQGLDLLIDTAELMKDEKIRWYIVGDGRAKDDMVKLVREKKLMDKVIFIGKVSEHEANCYVSYADCAYLSFKNNKIFNMTIPAKLQTYLACGVPIIAVVNGETRDIINKANCGYCITNQNSKAVMNAVIMLIKKHDNFDQYRENARVFYKNNFEKNYLQNELETIVKEVLY